MDNDTATPTAGPGPAHLLALRGRLLHRRQVLCDELDVLPPEWTDAGGAAVADTKDGAASTQSAELDDAQAQRHWRELKQVQAALNRMDWGLYGDCAECGEPIALQRLLAEPAAVCCTACATALERRAR